MAKKAGQVRSKRKTVKAAQKPVRRGATKSKKQRVGLPNVWQLTQTTAKTLWRNKKLFIGLTLVYGLLNLVLVQGLSSNTDISSLKHQLSQVFSGHLGSVGSSLSVFVVLVDSAGNSSSPTAGVYQLVLALIASLAVIWALRQLLAGRQLRIRDAYYRGMYPLIPFILVLMVVGLQLIPLLVGSTLYAVVTTNGIAVTVIEKLIWLFVFGVLALWTLYMLSSSLFALYIVTLPDMTPLKALRSARELVRHRRWTVLRKILWLPLALLLIAAVLMVPIIIWLTPLAQWLFFVLTMFVLVAVHGYMYTLYRELLNE